MHGDGKKRSAIPLPVREDNTDHFSIARPDDVHILPANGRHTNAVNEVVRNGHATQLESVTEKAFQLQRTYSSESADSLSKRSIFCCHGRHSTSKGTEHDRRNSGEPIRAMVLTSCVELCSVKAYTVELRLPPAKCQRTRMGPDGANARANLRLSGSRSALLAAQQNAAQWP